MWDRENRRAARRAYRQARRDARYQYRMSRQNWRGYGNRRLIVPFIILIVFFGTLFKSYFFYMAGSGHVFLLILLAVFGAVAFFAIRSFMLRGSGYQNPYQQPYDPSTQQPQQNPGQQAYYQAPPTPPQPERPPESYEGYNQGYQSSANPTGENQPFYRPKEVYSQDEQPQAYYPQQMPPMEQS